MRFISFNLSAVIEKVLVCGKIESGFPFLKTLEDVAGGEVLKWNLISEVKRWIKTE